MTIELSPKDAFGDILVSQEFNYTFNFTSNADCSDVIFSRNFVVSTNAYGNAIIDINITNLTNYPKYICEYRNGVFRKVHSSPRNMFSQIFVNDLRGTGLTNFSGEIYINNRTAVSSLSGGNFYFENFTSSFILNASIINNTNTISQLYNLTASQIANLSISQYGLFSLWATNGTTIYNDTAQAIGIGTSTPSNLLEVYNGGLAILDAVHAGYTAPANGILSIGSINVGGSGEYGEFYGYESTPNDESTLRLVNADTGGGTTNGYKGSMYTNVMFQHWLYENLPMVFATNNLIRMTINANGVLNLSENATTNKYFNGLWNGSRLYAPNTTKGIQSLINGSMIKLSSLNVSGTSYLGNMIINADNISVNNIKSVNSSSTFSGNITFGNYSNEFMRITGEGNVGIGTASPSDKLEISGGGIKVGSTGYDILFGTFRDGTALGIIDNNNNEFRFKAQNNANISFVDDSNNRFLYMVDGGNVGIGTSIPSEKLEVAGNVNISNGGNLTIGGQLTINGASRTSADTDDAQTIPDNTLTTIYFENEDFDNLGELNSSGQFTPKEQGYYFITGFISTESVTWTNSHTIRLWIYKNGVEHSLIGFNRFFALTTKTSIGGGSRTIYLDGVNDFVDLRVKHNRGANTDLSGSGTENYIDIHRLS